MTTPALCRVCDTVGETINADCGHQVHPQCCHGDGTDEHEIQVCDFCWHEPSIALERRERAEVAR